MIMIVITIYKTYFIIDIHNFIIIILYYILYIILYNYSNNYIITLKTPLEKCGNYRLAVSKYKWLANTYQFHQS